MVQATKRPGAAASHRDPVSAALDGLELDREARAIVGLFKVVKSARAMSSVDPIELGSTKLLVALAESGPTRLSDLAHATQLDLSTVSRHITTLEADGYVRRAPDPGDRRACLIEATPEADVVLRRLIHERVSCIAPVVRRWPEADRERLFDLLIRLADDMRTEEARLRDPHHQAPHQKDPHA